MMGERLLRVPEDLDGARLDRAVSQLADLSRAAGRRLVEAGSVRVNGEPVRAAAARVKEADVLAVPVPEPAEPLRPEPVEFSVVWEDDALAVVDKPAGLITHPGAGNPSGSLAAGLLHRWPVLAGVGDPGRWGIVHRLDKGTSGLLAVAKRQDAFDHLQEMIRRRRLDRRYLALVEGPMPVETGTVDAPIDRDPGRPVRRRVSPAGRPARTHFEQMGAWRAHGLLEVRLESGRTHQIRVHLAAIGHPVVGDRVYGASGGDPADPGRPWLHSWKLAFEHPLTGEQIRCEAPIPDDLRASIAKLGDPDRGALPQALTSIDRHELLLDTTTKLQLAFEDILYEEDPWGIAGGPRDEYNQIASRLISELTRTTAGDEAHRAREVIPEASEALVVRLVEEWEKHPLLHGVNRR